MDTRTIDRDLAMQLLGFLTAISDSQSDFSASAYKYASVIANALLSVEITCERGDAETMERILKKSKGR